MAYKITKWEYTGTTEPEDTSDRKYLSEGMRTLFIKNASYNPETYEYTLTLEDVDDEGAWSTLHYWMKTTDKDSNNIVDNRYTRLTLLSLGKALFHDEINDPPAPCDVIGGVVRAEVKYKESTNGKAYPRIYKFEPAPTSVVLCKSQLEDQYSVDE